MELLFAALGGALIGFVFHFALPGQETRGVLWTAGWATSAAVVVWELLTWLGWKPDTAGIWLVTLVVAALTGLGIARLSTVRRRESDRVLLEALMRGQG